MLVAYYEEFSVVSFHIYSFVSLEKVGISLGKKWETGICTGLHSQRLEKKITVFPLVKCYNY